LSQGFGGRSIGLTIIMQDTIKQISLVVVAGLLAAPVANWAVHGMESADGALGVPLVLAAHPTAATLHVVGAMVWFGILALVVGRLSHRYTGALVFGLGWTLVARRGIDTGELVRHLDTFGLSVSAAYWKFCVESVLLSLPTGLVVYLLAKKTRTRYEDEGGRFDPASVRGAVAGCVIGLIACWVFVVTDSKGQAVFGVLAGCMLAATVVRLAWPNCNGSMLYLVPIVVAVAGSISSAFTMSSGSILKMATGSIWPLARVMPIDYIGPGIFGIALGIGIARAFGAEEPDEVEQTWIDGRAGQLNV